MSAKPSIQIKHSPVKNYNVFQENYPGAQDDINKRGWFKNPTDFNTNNIVSAGLVWGNNLFVVGAFTQLCSIARAGFGAVLRDTGLVSSLWQATFSSVPHSLGTDGTYLYVGGSFTSVTSKSVSGDVYSPSAIHTTIDSTAINGLCRFDINGYLDGDWNPGCNSNPSINAFEYNSDTGTMYISGAGLTSIGGQSKNYIAEVSTTTGLATTWNPNPDGAVLTIKYDGSEYIYIGGNFTTVFATPRNNVAKITPGGGISTWDADLNGICRTITIDSDNSLVYLGGDFTDVNSGTTRNLICSVDTTVGTVTSFDPNVTGGNVFSIQLLRSLVFMFGNFTAIGGTTRNNAGCWDKLNDTLQDWNPDFNERVVYASLKSKTLYCVGYFTSEAVYGAVNYTSGNGKYIASIPYPLFTQDITLPVPLSGNTIFVNGASGDDTNIGTAQSAPLKTLAQALNFIDINLPGKHFIYIQDSSNFNEKVSYEYLGAVEGGIYSKDGEIPTIKVVRGAIQGTYGARITGRTQFSTGAAGTFYYVDGVNGDDGTGTRGDEALPFKTIQAAIADGSLVANDTIQIQDSSLYTFPIKVTLSTAITIQAKDGFTPVIYQSTNITDPILECSKGCNFYGITFWGSESTNAIKLTGAGETYNIYDCSFIGILTGIVNSSAVQIILNVYNSLFSGIVKQSIQNISLLTMVVYNCYFENSKHQAAWYSGTIELTYIGTSFILNQCSFIGGKASCCIINNDNATENGATTTIQNSYFDTLGTYGFYYGSIISGNTTFTNCYFSNLTTGAINVASLTGYTSTATGCVSYNCAIGFKFFSIATVTGCVALRSSANGFYLGGGGDIVNCVSVSCGGSGYTANSANPCGASGFIDSGSVTGIYYYAGTTGTVSHSCCSGNITNPTIGAGVFGSTDPLLLNTASGYENVGFSPNSVVYRGVPLGINMGIKSWIFTITSSNVFVVDGITFDGDVNFDNGINLNSTSSGTNIHVDNCSILNLGPVSMRIGNGITVSNSLFQTNGIGVDIVGRDSKIEYSVFDGCIGSGIVCGSPMVNTIDHVTAFACQYGQYDVVASENMVLKNCIYAQSGLYDYYGNGTLTNSVIPSIYTNATLTDGSQLNPLFRDVSTPDLRIQTIADGYLFDSPAYLLGDDGLDAGAYMMIYGSAGTSWTQFSFEDRNPDQIKRSVVPFKLAENNTFGFVTTSNAPGYRTQYDCQWESENDMTDALRDSIIALYKSPDSMIMVSFDDGTTWVKCSLIRSTNLEYIELGGLPYPGDSAIPTPISQIIFIETE